MILLQSTVPTYANNIGNGADKKTKITQSQNVQCQQLGRSAGPMINVLIVKTLMYYSEIAPSAKRNTTNSKVVVAKKIHKIRQNVNCCNLFTRFLKQIGCLFFICEVQFAHKICSCMNAVKIT